MGRGGGRTSGTPLSMARRPYRDMPTSRPEKGADEHTSLWARAPRVARTWEMGWRERGRERWGVERVGLEGWRG